MQMIRCQHKKVITDNRFIVIINMECINNRHYILSRKAHGRTCIDHKAEIDSRRIHFRRIIHVKH